MAASLEGSGGGLYFTVRVREELSIALGNGDIPGNWRNLAGELDFNGNEVESLRVAQQKEGHSPASDLLLIYQRRNGGVNFEEFRSYLLTIGRRDIVTDIWTEEKYEAGKLLEPYRPPFSCQVDDKLTSTTGLLTPSVQPVRDAFQQAVPKSDPVKRKSPSPNPQQRYSDPLPQDEPRNMTSSKSEITIVKEAPGTRPREREEKVGNLEEAETYQHTAQFHSLHSVSGVFQNGGNQASANPGPTPMRREYLVVSSTSVEDKHLSSKLVGILTRAGLKTHSLHCLVDWVPVFDKVTSVIVIYTLEYQREIGNSQSKNGALFVEMRREYRGNRDVNLRFIPVYDVAIIKRLPALLHCRENQAEREYILGILSNTNVAAMPPQRSPARLPHQQNVLSSHGPQSQTSASPRQPVILRERHA
ncbi:uncharacterized protein [Diadema setosum]|uniref:uncharacterized protein n=1 Tax=Diadema setosum TaxID=31175 RepID=UPI003B3A7D55